MKPLTTMRDELADNQSVPYANGIDVPFISAYATSYIRSGYRDGFNSGFNSATDLVFDRVVEWVKNNHKLYENDPYAMSILMLVDRLKEAKERILK